MMHYYGIPDPRIIGNLPFVIEQYMIMAWNAIEANGEDQPIIVIRK